MTGILRTSEFWIALLTLLGNFTVVKFGWVSAQEWQVLSSSAVVYVFSRIVSKVAKAAPGPGKTS